MLPGDQAVVVFIVAVFVIFSAAMAYASMTVRGERPSSKNQKK